MKGCERSALKPTHHPVALALSAPSLLLDSFLQVLTCMHDLPESSTFTKGMHRLKSTVPLI